jgi:DNA excision repair protein ERCC-1
LETYFSLENKPTDVLREKTEQDYVSQVENALTSIPSINKTDAMQLISNFKTFHALVNADKKELSKCPGIGPTKVLRFKEAFQMPFRKQ